MVSVEIDVFPGSAVRLSGAPRARLKPPVNVVIVRSWDRGPGPGAVNVGAGRFVPCGVGADSRAAWCHESALRRGAPVGASAAAVWCCAVAAVGVVCSVRVRVRCMPRKRIPPPVS